MIFEPKWDGFRCIVFRDGDEIVLGSRNERPLTRYFPELLEPLRRRAARRGASSTARSWWPAADGLDFDALQQRIHPAESRVKRLADETPGLVRGLRPARPRRPRPAWTSRSASGAALLDAGAAEAATRRCTSRRPPPTATWPPTGSSRFEGAGLDGVIAKPPDGVYEPNKRVQFKVKHQRTADCVVAGFRMHKDGDGVGSLLLGLYDDDGHAAPRRRGVELHRPAPQGAARRARALPRGRARGPPVARVGRGRGPARTDGASACPARRAAGTPRRTCSWTPLRPELVAEVAYEQVQNGRFRHSARLAALAPRPRRRSRAPTTSSKRSPPRAGRHLRRLTRPLGRSC